eukprot:Cvel_25565.t1-p1 / transcript=Cvel_25565.t1 / gene=Cvel_25565 / organism=Chromera_velia_CCMP2878 / gene_product=Chromosome partition protein Smc, putative / transcript_product=Chromosome partition protein Smc, putative / location=Cvel_scaffold2913:12347-21249(+) / protein_length=580 / sequence_SO=supercontig / SO=protein_coding / is_pseudo=false
MTSVLEELKKEAALLNSMHQELTRQGKLLDDDTFDDGGDLPAPGTIVSVKTGRRSLPSFGTNGASFLERQHTSEEPDASPAPHMAVSRPSAGYPLLPPSHSQRTSGQWGPSTSDGLRTVQRGSHRGAPGEPTFRVSGPAGGGMGGLPSYTGSGDGPEGGGEDGDGFAVKIEANFGERGDESDLVGLGGGGLEALKRERRQLVEWGEGLYKELRSLERAKEGLEGRLEDERSLQENLRNAHSKLLERCVRLETAQREREKSPLAEGGVGGLGGPQQRELESLRQQLEVYGAEVDQLRRDRAEALQLLEEAHRGEEAAMEERDGARAKKAAAEKETEGVRERLERVTGVLEELTELKETFADEIEKKKKELAESKRQLQQARDEAMQVRVHAQALQMRLGESAEEIVRGKNAHRGIASVAQRLKDMLADVSASSVAFAEEVQSRQAHAMQAVATASAELRQLESRHQGALLAERRSSLEMAMGEEGVKIAELQRDLEMQKRQLARTNAGQVVSLKERFKKATEDLRTAILEREKKILDLKRRRRAPSLLSVVRNMMAMSRGTVVQKAQFGKKLTKVQPRFLR